MFVKFWRSLQHHLTRLVVMETHALECYPIPCESSYESPVNLRRHWQVMEDAYLSIEVKGSDKIGVPNLEVDATPLDRPGVDETHI